MNKWVNVCVCDNELELYTFLNKFCTALQLFVLVNKKQSGGVGEREMAADVMQWKLKIQKQENIVHTINNIIPFFIMYAYVFNSL
jgi:hypothetical protein